MKYIPLLIYLLFVAFSGAAQEETKADSTKQEKSKKKKDLPLESGRTVHIKSTEGTWMSLDVSPDSKTIAFDFLGDIYLLPFAGGKAERFTSGLAFDSHPKFSPDGKHLLFISDRSGGENVWRFSLDKKDSLQITKGNTDTYQSAEWSPDGNYIVASKGRRNLKMFLYHKDGGGGAQLISKPDNLKVVEPAFGPDSRYLWFAQRIGAWNYNAQLPQYQLATYDRETGDTETQTNRYGSAFTPTLSPDGKWLVYGTRHNEHTGLILRDLKSGEERWLAYPVQRDEQESIAPLGVLPAMSFTPDSKEVVASYGGKLWRIPVAGGKAVQIPFEVDVQLELGPKLDFKYPISDAKEMIVTQIRDGKVSPDGKQLAFTALNRLYLMDLPNGTPKRVTNFNFTEAMPAWNPDGSQLAWVSWEENVGGSLYKINFKAKGAKPVKVTSSSGVYSDPAWSYKSNRIVFLQGPAQFFKDADGPFAFKAKESLAWISTEGGAVTVIDKSKGRGAPHFVKNDDRIYLYHGGKGLISIRWDGTDEKAHVKVTGITVYGTTSDDVHGYVNHCMLAETEREPQQEPSNATMVMMAPEGDQAIAQINNEIYVVTIPKTGGETPKISVSSPESSQFPSRKLTTIGGQFACWNNNGKKVYWSIGNAFFTYDLDEAKAKEEELKKKKAEEAKAGSVLTLACVSGRKEKQKRRRTEKKRKMKATNLQKSGLRLPCRAISLQVKCCLPMRASLP